MMTRHALVACILAAAAWSAAAAEPPKADDATPAAIEKIAAKTANVKSFSAEFNLSARLGAHKMASKGTIQFCAPDKFRMVASSPVGPGEYTTVSDGNITWMIMSTSGLHVRIDMEKVKAALGGPAPPAQSVPHNIASPLALLRPETCKLVGTEKVQDQECWVFEGRPIVQANMPGAEGARGARVCVAAEDGLTRRLEFLDAAGEAVLKITYDKITVNPDPAPAVFHYEPPEDAAVFDQTEQMIAALKAMAAQPEKKDAEPKE